MSIMNVTKNVKNQFSNDKNLAMRINFYKKYTTNKYKFADWLFDKYVFKENMKILELGCGNGNHWEGKIDTIPNGCSLVLSDFSEGMLDLVREKFSTNKNVSIKQIDIQEIPFEDETFDVVIANHMLFHVPDLITRSKKSIKSRWSILFCNGWQWRNETVFTQCNSKI